MYIHKPNIIFPEQELQSITQYSQLEELHTLAKSGLITTHSWTQE